MKRVFIIILICIILIVIAFFVYAKLNFVQTPSGEISGLSAHSSIGSSSPAVISSLTAPAPSTQSSLTAQKSTLAEQKIVDSLSAPSK